MLAEMSAVEWAEWQAKLTMDHDYRKAVAGGVDPELAHQACYRPPKD